MRPASESLQSQLRGDGTSPTMPMPRFCHSLNVGGTRANVHRVFACLGQDSHVVALQESLLTREAQRSLTRMTNQEGCLVAWGAPAPLKATRNGHWRVDRKHPGLAVVCSAELGLHSVSFVTLKAQQWHSRGRMMMVRLGQASKPMYLLNLYAPAGNEGRHLRDQFLSWEMFRKIGL